MHFQTTVSLPQQQDSRLLKFHKKGIIFKHVNRLYFHHTEGEKETPKQKINKKNLMEQKNQRFINKLLP